MNDGLGDLYQELILDHQRHPHNFGDLPGANRRASGNNPLCGDQIRVDLLLDPEGRVADVRFRGTGCAISRASASLMTDAVRGKTREEVEALFDLFHGLVTGTVDPEEAALRLGKLKVFAGVREFPARVKCASLAWHTMKAALEAGESADGATVSTEEGS